MVLGSAWGEARVRAPSEWGEERRGGRESGRRRGGVVGLGGAEDGTDAAVGGRAGCVRQGWAGGVVAGERSPDC